MEDLPAQPQEVPRPSPELRVSDAERDRVVEHLKASAGEGRISMDEFSSRVGEVYRARTGIELYGLTADLPAPPQPSAVAVAETRTRRVVSVLSGAKRRGPWKPDARVHAVAVMGSCQLDLTEAELPDEGVVVVATAVFGGVDVVVTEGTPVELSGYAVLGGKDYRVKGSVSQGGGPLVRVRSRAVLGGVTVRSHPFRKGPRQL
ncbi:MAG: hypothetical protein JJLCMIEE_02923 [Acidimicrobiales bacterium]|nr:MAG: DUF1707 and DUF2154 domain-containing protein [Actinomycetota bacterium]MBV6509822.1 hypothetical protein [Acidimicrobiales bacterium]RIK04421.1 MAG: hypothetical protein DCC48_13670 [Acidobacteriota bacterium]